MTEEDAFLLDLLARPDDEASRLIYADWLLDRDDPRAELVREAYELRAVKPGAQAHYDHSVRWWRARVEHGWQEYDGLLLTWEQMVTVFRFRLAEVIAFCGGELPPARTWELDPRALLGRSSAAWPIGSRTDDGVWASMTNEVAMNRRRHLERAGRAPSRLPTHLASGRLLLFAPSGCIGGGAGSLVSKGYFDEQNVPAWDGWVLYLPSYEESGGRVQAGCLYVWVPPAWLHYAGQGITAAQMTCGDWSTGATPFVRILREAGISGV